MSGIFITVGGPSDIEVSTSPPQDAIIDAGSGGPIGPIGPAGPPGTPGADGTDGASGGFFRFVQGTSSAVWTIAHGLPYEPNVTVVDSSGTQVEGDVSYVGNTVVVRFSGAFAGTAYLS